VDFDSLEWLLKQLTALAELTYKLAKKLWAPLQRSTLGRAVLRGNYTTAREMVSIFILLAPIRSSL